MFSSKWKVIAAKETFARDNFNFICHLSPYEYNKLVYKMLGGDRWGDRRFRLSPFLFAVFHIVSCA